jgi:hypothetical protein
LVRDKRIAVDLIGEVFLDVRQQSGNEKLRRGRRFVGIPGNIVTTRSYGARERLGRPAKAAGVERGWP